MARACSAPLRGITFGQPHKQPRGRGKAIHPMQSEEELPCELELGRRARRGEEGGGGAPGIVSPCRRMALAFVALSLVP
jgi:hypothetical protein